MPNIVDLSINCLSNCSLLGTAAIMRDFLLGKNLPQVPTDVIQAGYANQWYNNSNLAAEYNNFEPQALVDLGNVLSNIDSFRTQHASLNLYDDYSNEHYNASQFSNYTEYPLISIDDSQVAVTLHSFGNVEEWTDPEDALVVIDTWITKWIFELGLNKYNPSVTYNNITSLTDHSDNVVTDISILTTNIITQFLSTNYNISSFITPDDPNTIWTPLSYYQQLLEPFNRYYQNINDSYWPSYFGLSYFNYADPNLTSPSLNINPNHENIDNISDSEGLNITAFPTSTPQGARDWYNSTFNDYSINNVYPANGNALTYGNIDFFPPNDPANGFLPSRDVKDNIIQSIDSFYLEVVPETGSYGLVENEQYSPEVLRELHCLAVSDRNTTLALQRGNIYGAGSNSSEITSEVEVVTNPNIINYNTTQKDAFVCYSYVDSVIDPFTYGIQDARGVAENIFRPETVGQENYLPPQATINVANGVPMDTRHFGITSEISNALGFVLPASPMPLDAVLNQIDKNIKDTPLGKTARVKLASEFFNRIAENLRHEAYGMAEKIGAGLVSLAGNLLGPIVGRDTSFKSGFQQIADAFKRHDITVPKSFIGKTASLVANLAGSNIMLDPIKEPIAWTSNVPKTESKDTDDGIGELSRTKRGFWNKLLGIGTTSVTNDPSEILLAYTSSGQKDFLKASIELNEYRPYYQISGFLDFDAKRQNKLQKKKQDLLKKLTNLNAEIELAQKIIDESTKEIELIKSSTASDGPRKNKIKRVKFFRSGIDNEDEAKAFLIEEENIKIQKAINTKLKAESEKKDVQLGLKQLDSLLPYYPIYDDGTFKGTQLNSRLKSRSDLAEVVNQQGANHKVDRDGFKDYSEDAINLDNNLSRYSLNRNVGLAPEKDDIRKSYFKEETIYEDQIYATVKDLVKHGIKPDNSAQSDLRGLNLRSDYPFVGYNVYPLLDDNTGTGNKLNVPGLGREEYNGQSLFSVLESNGFVKISPLWEGNQFESVKKQKEKLEKFSQDAAYDYKEKVTIHRYMFSIENLAWKGFTQNLPWWERGPNGGRIMWFPPYDLKVTDTSSVALGAENLIGRNEPVYTYSHTERSGILSFKLIMDFPGYYYDSGIELKQEQETSKRDTSEVESLQSAIPPKSYNKVNWWLDSNTYIYIIMDDSGSMSKNAASIISLFGPNGFFKKRLIQDKVYTEDQYHKRVFIFKDPGLMHGSDNIDDGRFFAWFAVPYFKSIGAVETNTLAWNPKTGGYISAQPLPNRLNCISNNENYLPSPAELQKVVVIALLNESSPSYFYPDVSSVVNSSNRLYHDIADYLYAKSQYSQFRGVVLAYHWASDSSIAKLENSLLYGMLAVMCGGSGSETQLITSQVNTTNNIYVQNPPVIPWALPEINYTWDTSTLYSGNYSITPQTQMPSIYGFSDILYQFGINVLNSVKGTDEGGETVVNNIIYVLKKTLAKDPNEVPAEIKPNEEYSHDKIKLLREFLIKATQDNPSKTTDVSLVWNDGNLTPVKQSEIKEAIGAESIDREKVYDVELHQFILTGKNSKTVNLSSSGDTEMVFLLPDGGTESILTWLQEKAGGESNFKMNGEITSEGWKQLLKSVLNPDDPIANQSDDPNNNVLQKPQSKVLTKNIRWGIDVEDLEPENPLNEFLYFKRKMQSDPLYVDTIREKIAFFDPAFHSVTPVGFSNRLNFLEQCARQGPSINNMQTEDGKIISANSNLAFGRPPISVLRIGDFYYTRIAIESVDLSYEPLIFDLNPEGIGVQPMIVDVTINFKYLGGSSLSGPITQLQNAISNNYFANVEFYHTQALKAFERNFRGSFFSPKDSLTNEPISDVQFVEPKAVDNLLNTINSSNSGFNNNSQIQQNSQTVQNLQASKKTNKRDKTRKCQYCPEGYVLYGNPQANVPYSSPITTFNPFTNQYETLDPMAGYNVHPLGKGTEILCVKKEDLGKVMSLPNYFGFKPCKQINLLSIAVDDAIKLQKKYGYGCLENTDPVANAEFRKLCKKMGDGCQ